MEKIRLLLYCTKQPLYLVRNECDGYFYTMDKGTLNDYKNVETYNGKIVAECDYEVEEIRIVDDEIWNWWYETKTLSKNELCEKSCLSEDEIYDYLEENEGYAIHIKNLHIFDDPRELSDYWKKGERVKNAPQNMMLVQNIYEDKVVISLKELEAIKVEEYILISIKPEWLCKILNGEKTILVRKKVLKEMVK